MDQHPIPRQITTFEFKLIGFLTLKQFIYLIIFTPAAAIVYKIFPIPLINIALAALIGGLGAALAFMPINDRPLDVWIKNLVKRLTSPTQYLYRKQNLPIYFLSDLYFVSDPHRALTHIESREKLADYLTKTKPKSSTHPKKRQINALLMKQSPLRQNAGKSQSIDTTLKNATPLPLSLTSKTPSLTQKPFFTGIVKNHKAIPLPGILIYVKGEDSHVLRLLKTNPHGIFATFNPLSPGEYIFEFKDPKNTYFFDTMKTHIADSNQKPLEFYSKELI